MAKRVFSAGSCKCWARQLGRRCGSIQARCAYRTPAVNTSIRLAGKHQVDRGAGLQLEPQNETAKKALEDTIAGRANARSGGAGGVGGGLFGADFMGRVAMDPQSRPLLGDPEFMSMLRDVQQNPMQNMTKYLSNPKFQLAMQVSTLCWTCQLFELKYCCLAGADMRVAS